MSQTNRSDATLFQARNHHSATSGPPPHIDDLRPNQYLGYFENEHGEQAVFAAGRRLPIHNGWAEPQLPRRGVGVFDQEADAVGEVTVPERR